MNEIPEKDNREVEIDMPDGSTWAISLETMARVQADSLTTLTPEDRETYFWNVMHHAETYLTGKLGLLSWEWLAPHARLVRQGESRLYDEGLMHGAKRITGD